MQWCHGSGRGVDLRWPRFIRSVFKLLSSFVRCNFLLVGYVFFTFKFPLFSAYSYGLYGNFPLISLKPYINRVGLFDFLIFFCSPQHI